MAAGIKIALVLVSYCFSVAFALAHFNPIHDLAAPLQIRQLLAPEARRNGAFKNKMNALMPDYRVLHLSRHPGTTGDINHVLAVELGYKVVQVHPQHQFGIRPGKIRREDAEKAFAEKNGWALCAAYDAIVFTDTTMDTWPFLLAVVKGQCPTSLIIDVTNRFDWYFMHEGFWPNSQREWPVDDADFKDFLFDFDAALALDTVFLVQNNAFEKVYIENRGVKVPPTIETIRPWGYISNYKYDGAVENDKSKVAIIGKVTGDMWLAERCKELGIAFTHLERHYGGARRLANFRGMLHIPYQVSIMAMWENLAAGVVTMIPSQGFLEEILRNTTIQEYETAFRLMVLNKEPFFNQTFMAQVVDWYMPEFEHLWIQFKSWDELITLVSGQKDQMLVQHSKHVKRYMRNVHQPLVTAQWQQLVMRAVQSKPQTPKGMMAEEPKS